MIPVSFKAKVQTMYNYDDTIAYQYISVPAITTAHVDMRAARSAPKLGSYANSNMFLSIVNGLANSVLKLSSARRLRLDQLPDGVSVDTSKFLAVVSFSVPDALRID